ncbi:HAD-IA family hydrolase [bacterium]|nr:HAD-IA family hydrolase [bacterium]
MRRDFLFIRPVVLNEKSSKTVPRHELDFIFDLNGVLILDKPGYQSPESEQKFFKRMGISLNDAKEKGLIQKERGWNDDQFWKYVGNGWKGAIPNMELAQIVKEIRGKGMKTAIISNTSGLIMREKINQYFGEGITSLFDEIIISSEVGFLKPDPEIYKLALKRLYVSAHDSVMVDDSDSYLTGARFLEIMCFLFTDNRSLIQDMKNLGVVD